MKTEIESWGRFPQVKQDFADLIWASEPVPQDAETILPFGLGRSYGDSCLNSQGLVLRTRGLNHFLDFNPETGILKCESGVTIAQILETFLPHGWVIPVTPGTKFVTIGGAIANDVHGKNHHHSGTFGCHVLSFELLRSDGSRIVCSPHINIDFFRATIGGLGLTGLITWAAIQLKKVSGPFIDEEAIKFKSLDEFFKLSQESEKFEYSVSWIDGLAKGKGRGRGIFYRGSHSSKAPKADFKIQTEPKLNVPFSIP